jgi:hypothetical protein
VPAARHERHPAEKEVGSPIGEPCALEPSIRESCGACDDLRARVGLNVTRTDSAKLPLRAPTMERETGDETDHGSHRHPAGVERDGNGACPGAYLDRHAGEDPRDHCEDRRADTDEDAAQSGHRNRRMLSPHSSDERADETVAPFERFYRTRLLVKTCFPRRRVYVSPCFGSLES